jgi:hypothetical protein
MIYASTPLTQLRAAMVQDLYQMAFHRQLERADSGEGDSDSASEPLTDAALATLLRDYAAVLEQTDHLDESQLLIGLASETAHHRDLY